MKKFLLSLAALALLLGALPTYAASYPVGGTTYYLAGAGINSTASTIQLTSFKTPDGNNIVMTSFGAKGYGALEVGTSKLENISFTGVTQNANGTALLTGVSRGLLFTTPFTASTTLAKAHSGAANFVLSNTASYYGDQFAFVNNPSVVTDYWTFPSPLAGSNPATKTYVDNLVNGGTITSSSVIAPGTAGETVSAGQIVYLNTSDGRWYKAGTGVTASVVDSALGIAQGAGTAGVAITGGVNLWGLDSNQSGLTVGAPYFLGATAGTASSATSTRSLGKARSTTSLYFTPGFFPQASFTATTTIAASNVNSKALALNGVNYAFPPSQGASSTALVNDGTGTLGWGGYSNLLGDTNAGASVADNATTTIYTNTIPANILSLGNVIRVTIYGLRFGGNGNAVFIQAGYGTASTTIYAGAPQVPGVASATWPSGQITLLIKGNGSTSSQKVFMSMLNSYMGTSLTSMASTTATSTTNTLAVNSTTAQPLLISLFCGTNVSCSTQFTTTEILRQ